MVRFNYHTHTYRCKHADGDIQDFIRAAESGGLEKLGFSEHMPLVGDRWSHVHMAYSELDEYVDTIRNSRSSITVLAGGECEYVKADHAYYREELLGRYGLDYLLGAPHWIPCGGEWTGYSHLESPKDLICFADYCTDLIDSGLFLYVAHPDVFMVGYPKWDENALSCAEDIISAALACDIPLEFNANGLRKSAVTREEEMEHSLYPNLNFWKVAAQRGVKSVIGSDAHSPELLTDSLDLCEHMAGSLGLQLVDPLIL